MDIGIFIEYNGRIVQIPVNPPSFEVNTGGNNETLEIVKLGEIILPKKAKLSEISWESFFPYEDWHPAIRTKGSFQSAKFYLDFLNKIRDDCKPCRLTVTGIGFDEQVVIQSFDYYHQAGDHEDTYYSISFKKYQPYSVSIVSKVDLSSLKSKPATNTVSNSKVAPTPKQVTVGCDVILNGRVYYDSYGGKPYSKPYTNYKGKVNLINSKGSHPYHITSPSGGWLGWAAKESVVLA